MANRSSRSRWTSTASTSRRATCSIRRPSVSTAGTKSSTPIVRRARRSSSSMCASPSSARSRSCRRAPAPASATRRSRRRAVGSGSATGSRSPCTGWTRWRPGRRSRARRSSSRPRPRCWSARASESRSLRTAGSTSASAERVRGDLRHNVAALGADYALFVVGLAFASQSTILPAFAAHLGAPNVVIGAIPAVMTLGWFLPSLFAAGYTESLARKLPFIVRYTIWERVPFIVLSLAAFFLADRAPAAALGLMLLMLLDVTGRAIPVTLRGRFFAFANLAASVGGLGGSVATASILAAVPAPASYGVCFACTTVFLAISYVALVAVREPATTESAPATRLSEYLSRIPGLLGRDPNLTWFLTARAFGMVGSIGSAFYTVYALGAWDAPAAQAGVFTTLLFVGQMAGNAVLGWLADRRGHRLVIILGLGATLAGNLS